MDNGVAGKGKAGYAVSAVPNLVMRSAADGGGVSRVDRIALELGPELGVVPSGYRLRPSDVMAILEARGALALFSDASAHEMFPNGPRLKYWPAVPPKLLPHPV